MLSYQHIYHAGNFADVQKHAVLAALIRLLALKPQSFSVLDTHAGRGLYDLSSEEAQKVGEFRHGILPFWETRREKSPLSDYLALVESFNDGDALTFYPGSAKIAHKLMRAGDRLTLVERHPGEFAELQKAFAGARNVTLAPTDGFAALVDKMPLEPRRGLVLVDPSYEIKTEYNDLPRLLRQALAKWPQAPVMVWYPMLPAGLHHPMLTSLRKTNIKDMLVSEIRLPETTPGMYGTGVILINPPFGFEATLEEMTHYIAHRLPKAEGRVFWLNNQPIDPETGRLAL